MEQVIKLVKTYRITANLAERIRLAEEIFRLIEPDLRLFVFNSVQPTTAEDVLQEILKGIAGSLKRFEGNTHEAFWAWCYRVARNKLNDQFRKQASDRLQLMPQDELWQMLEASAQTMPMTAADRHDLEFALKLLDRSKPECKEFLWKHYVFGLAYGEIAEESNLSYDNARMKIGRCLDTARELVAQHA